MYDMHVLMRTCYLDLYDFLIGIDVPGNAASADVVTHIHKYVTISAKCAYVAVIVIQYV